MDSHLALTKWNSAEYSDAELIIIQNQPHLQTKIHVNRYVLSLNCLYFDEYLKKDLNNRVIQVTFSNEKETQYFLEIIRCIYKLPLQIDTTDDLVSLIIMANHYRCILVMKLAMKKLVNIPLSIDSARLYLEKLTQSELAYKLPAELNKTAIDLLVNNFKDLRSVFTGVIDGKKRKDDFLNLPPAAIIGWVKSNDLVIDSENSVFYFVMLWILKDNKKEERLPYFPEIIKEIRFNHMRLQYLIDVIPQAIKSLTDETHITILREKRNQILRYNLLPKRYEQSILRPPQRSQLPETDKVMIKCVFQEVSKWEETGKYYSSPVLINGYEFYFFLQRQLVSKSTENPVYGMAGFLRCSGHLIPAHHYLPIAYSVSIQTPRQDIRERKFSTMRVIFEAPEKAIGGKLTLANEKWEDVIKGNSPIVNQNTITVVVTIEFLNTDEGCLAMQDTDSVNESNSIR